MLANYVSGILLCKTPCCLQKRSCTLEALEEDLSWKHVKAFLNDCGIDLPIDKHKVGYAAAQIYTSRMSTFHGKQLHIYTLSEDPLPL